MVLNPTKVLALILMLPFLGPLGCRTKGDVIREQQLKKLQQEVRAGRSNRINSSQSQEELKMEITRLGGLVDQASQRTALLTQKVDSLEKRVVRIERGPQTRSQPAKPKVKVTYESGKKLFESGKYAQATAVLRTVVRTEKPRSATARKATFLLGETYYANKEYGLAALEFAQYKSSYPKDGLVPRATFQQANAFKMLGKRKEAKLFYSELMDRYPKHALAKKAKKEIRALK